MRQNRYTSGEHLACNPTWHAEESPWKARYVLRILAKNRIVPRTICDVGCGAGEVLRLVQTGLDQGCSLSGYDISPQAIELAQHRANDRLHFTLGDVREEPGASFDLILLLDVIEHLENYFDFLRDVQPLATYKIIQIPLDITVRSVAAGNLIKWRAAHGHLHYFTKDVAIQMLRDLGYEVVDYIYTWQENSNSLNYIWNQNKHDTRLLVRRLTGFFARATLAIPSHVFFAIHPDAAARVMGRWRLLVLAR